MWRLEKHSFHSPRGKIINLDTQGYKIRPRSFNTFVCEWKKKGLMPRCQNLLMILCYSGKKQQQKIQAKPAGLNG